jgi:hypothetical protein
MNLDEIYLSKGIGDFAFGMTKEAVIELLGNEYEEKIDDDSDLELQYEELDLRFTFWKDYGLRLCVISTERKSATLNNECLSGKTKQDLRNFIKNKLRSKLSEEDGFIHEDGHHQEWIEVSERNVSFWFRDDKLYLIDCFCAWDDDDNPIWSYSNA